MRIIGLLFEMISTVFLLYSYEYVFNHIFGELRGNALPHDLADSDDEDLVNVEDDDGVKVGPTAGDGGGDDRPPFNTHIPTGCGGCFANRGKGTRKPIWVEGKRGRNTYARSPEPRILMRASSSISKSCTIQQGFSQAAHWVINPRTGTMMWSTIRHGRGVPRSITPGRLGCPVLHFGMIPGTSSEPLTIAENRAKSTEFAVAIPNQLLALRVEMETREDLSLIEQFFVTPPLTGYSYGMRIELFEEMVRLRAQGSNTESGVPYTDEEINAMAQKGKQRGHLPGVGRVLPGLAIICPHSAPSAPPFNSTPNSDDVGKAEKERTIKSAMSADVARGHSGDGGGDDRPPSHHIPTGCGGCFANRGKGTRKANLGGRKAGRIHTRQETRNLGLKKITDDKGPVPIRLEWEYKKTMMPLGGHASHWSNYLRELIREMPLYYPSWQKVLAERKAAIVTKIGANMDVPRALPWQIGMPRLHFGMIPGTKLEPLKIAKTEQRARSFAGRDPNHLLAFEMRWGIHYEDEDRGGAGKAAGSGSNTSRCALTDERDLLPWLEREAAGEPSRVGRSDDKFSQMLTQYESTPEFGSRSGGCGDDEIADDEDGGEDGEDEEDGDS
ncbi:hypothetical protein Tco_0987958 [Tanacetum coccineum]|uniref:Uncharacterized protein n=1 Tax=Tanacetum coccineum TaxID=301880 RepID=A0ABQ5EPZ2_9ASTR